MPSRDHPVIAATPQSACRFGIVAWVALALGGLMAASMLGCRTSAEGQGFGDGVDRFLDPSKSGAQWAWVHTQEVTPRIERYAFYVDAGPAQATSYLRSPVVTELYQAARHNDRGQLGAMLSDTRLEIYVLPTGERVWGPDWQRHQAQRRRTLRGETAAPPSNEEGRFQRPPLPEDDAARDDTAAGDDRPASTPASLPEPRERLGTLAMFGPRGQTLTLAVYREPATNRWFFRISGAKGDTAYYEMGRVAATTLAGAQERLLPVHRPR